MNEESKEINILLLGETGVGKSTWINGFVNYLSYDSLEEAERGEPVSVIPAMFTLTDSDFKEHTITYGVDGDTNESTGNVGESATQMPKSYVFDMQNVKIRIIDTPGMGATGGIDKDKENMQNILNHLSHYKEINGIIILLKPKNTRLNVMFEFCTKELLTYLHKDACKNILICFTNARETNYRPGDTMPLLKELLSRNQIIDINLTKDTVYCMDNEYVRFLIAKKEFEYDESDKQDFTASWTKAVAESKRMISHISSLKPHAIQNTLSINEIRRSVIELSRPMAEIAKAIQINIDRIKEKEAEEIDSNKNNVELYKQLQIPTTRIKTIKLDYARTVCTATKCVELISADGGASQIRYKTICHDKCREITTDKNVIGSATIKQCEVMKRGWIRFWKKWCDVCECDWYIHMHITYDLAQETVMVEDPEIRKLIDEKDGSIKAIEKHKMQLENKLKQLKFEEKRLTEINAHFACFLKHNSIIPYNDALKEYLNYLITNEKSRPGGGNYSKTCEGLSNLKEVYEEETRVIEDRLKTDTDAIQCLDMGNINKLMKELKELPAIGPMLKDILAIVREANDASTKSSEKVILLPWTNSVSQLTGMVKERYYKLVSYFKR